MTPARDILPGVIVRVQRLQTAMRCVQIVDRATRWARRSVLATDGEVHEVRAAFARGYRRALEKRVLELAEVES